MRPAAGQRKAVSMGLVAAVAFLALFIAFVVLPTQIQKRRERDQEE